MTWYVPTESNIVGIEPAISRTNFCIASMDLQIREMKIKEFRTGMFHHTCRLIWTETASNNPGSSLSIMWRYCAAAKRRSNPNGPISSFPRIWHHNFKKIYCDVKAESLNNLTKKVICYQAISGKNVSTATKTRYRSNGYARYNRGIVGSGVFYTFSAEAI
jgi:hypothetical protein